MRRRSDRLLDLPWAELVLVVGLAVVAGLSWLTLLPRGALVAPVIIAAAVATALVALHALWGRPGAAVDLGLSAIGYVVVAGLVLFRSTTFGGLPTLATLRAIHDGLVNGVARTLASSVPAPAIASIRLVPFTVAWLAGLWGAALTLRSRSTLTPGVAAVAGFAFGLVMGGAGDLTGLAGALVATEVLYVVVRGARSSGLNRRSTSRRALRFGLPAAVVITLVSVGTASAVTFAAAPYDLHDRAAITVDPRAALTPLREIQARMSLPRPVTLFDVHVDPATAELPNLRLSVLDQFDGSQWSSSERFVEASGTLPPAPATTATTETITAEVTVHDLDGFWLPAPATPVGVSLPLVDVGGGSQSLATPSRSVAGLHYSVQSTVPRPTAAQLQDAQPGDEDPSLADLPDGPPADVAVIRATAAKATAGATTPYAQLVALQTFLRAAPFRVTHDAPAGESYARVARFLASDHAGTSEQFATAYALLARALGWPTRVVAGFRHGPVKDGMVAVTSADAYAWADVSLAGLGWVPFDPTPGPTPTLTAPPASPALVAPPATDAGVPDPNATPQEAPTPAPEAASTSTSPLLVTGLALAVLVLVGIVLLPLTVVAVRARRTRARRRATNPRDRVLGAWRHAAGALRPPPERAASSLTATEWAGLAASRLGDDLGAQLAELGALANQARFDPDQVDPADGSAAWARADAFRRAARRHLRPGTRLATAIDPRSLRHA